MQLQSYNLDVVFKPGPEMHVSDVLSRATPPCWRSDTPYVQHAVCPIDSTQADYAQLDQAQHLNVTALRFCQIVQHTATDDVLQELTSAVSSWNSSPAQRRMSRRLKPHCLSQAAYSHNE